MRTSRILSTGLLALTLASTGAMVDAQTAPVPPAMPQAQDQGQPQPPAIGQPQVQSQPESQPQPPSMRRKGGLDGPDGFHGRPYSHGKQHGGRHGSGPDPRGGGAWGGRDPGMMGELFTRSDTDGDGRITQAEIDAERSARVGAADASGDGALSLEEFDTLYRELTRTRMVRAFQSLDTDGDGVISPAEMDARFGRLAERMDRNGDGALSLPGGGQAR